jgi:hypothetical protein
VQCISCGSRHRSYLLRDLTNNERNCFSYPVKYYAKALHGDIGSGLSGKDTP